jgi:hypothetical protein
MLGRGFGLDPQLAHYWNSVNPVMFLLTISVYLFKMHLPIMRKSLPGKTMSGSFFWEDYDGLQFNNAVSMKEIDFPSDLTEISQDQSFELFWEGMPLKNDEYVAVAINGNFEGDASIIWERGNGSQSIAIPKSQLEKLPVDQPATFWLEFGYNPPLAQATGAGGEIYGKYRVSKTIMIR